MKKIRRKKVVLLLVFFELTLVIGSLIITAQAWNNGDGSQNFNVYDTNQLADWWSKRYGTHDWIAEAALDAITQHVSTGEKWKDIEGNEFWTERRIIIFLIGTEAPDTPKVATTNQPDNWLRIKLDNVEVGGWGSINEKKYHHLYFYKNDYGLILDGKSYRMKLKTPLVESRIKEYERVAMKYLKQEKCDLAAFYMGAVIHYIADMSNFIHVLEFQQDVYDIFDNDPEDKQKTNFENLHTAFETAVQGVTDDHTNREEFFDYSTDFQIASSRSSYECAKLLAFDTRWDLQEDEIDIRDPNMTPAWDPGDDEARELYYEFNKNMYGKRSNANLWIPDHTEFKNRVQECLQRVIKYCADAINFMADAWTTKTCKDCQKSDKAPAPSQRLSKVMTAFVSTLMFLGIAAAELTTILIPMGSSMSKGI